MQCHEWYTTNLVYAEMHSRLYLTEKLQLNPDDNVPISHADVTKHVSIVSMGIDERIW